MTKILYDFGLAFVPIFVAFNVFGVLPIYISLTESLRKAERDVLIRKASATAFLVAAIFLFAGKSLFTMIGITADDFRIGGGIVLALIALLDLLFSQQETRRNPHTDIGIVPVGIPLIMGPAALTQTMMSVDRFGYLLTLVVLFVNIFIVWLVFTQSHRIVRLIGEGGMKAVAKVFSLFLLAIAVMMIRVGIQNTISSF